jgi:hypothetical protein
MYVYIKSDLIGGWKVGFYNPAGRFVKESHHSMKVDAAKRVHWLNGGNNE